MATAKTAKKATKSSSPKKKTTLADLKNKVWAPKNRKATLIILGVIVLAALLYIGRSLFVAATVNGEPISRLSLINKLELQSGKTALEEIIEERLVLQEAAKRKINISQADIDKEIAKIKKQLDGQGQDLNQILESRSISKELFNEQIKIQLIVDKILGEQAKVGEDEFNKFLEQNKDLLANEKNPDDAKMQYRQYLEQEKLKQKYQEWVATLKKNAKILHYVSY